MVADGGLSDIGARCLDERHVERLREQDREIRRLRAAAVPPGTLEFVAYAVGSMGLTLGETHPSVVAGRAIISALEKIARENKQA